MESINYLFKGQTGANPGAFRKKGSGASGYLCPIPLMVREYGKGLKLELGSGCRTAIGRADFKYLHCDGDTGLLPYFSSN